MFVCVIEIDRESVCLRERERACVCVKRECVESLCVVGERERESGVKIYRGAPKTEKHSKRVFKN